MIPTTCSICAQPIRPTETVRYNPRTGTLRHETCQLPAPAPAITPPPGTVAAQRPIAFTPEEEQ